MKLNICLILIFFNTNFLFSQSEECKILLRIDVLNKDWNFWRLEELKLGKNIIIRYDDNDKLNYTTIIELKDCRGKLNILQYYSYPDNLKLTGSYSNCPDTLKTLLDSIEPVIPYRTFYYVCPYFQPLRNGKWQYYDYKGKIIKDELYENGTLIDFNQY